MGIDRPLENQIPQLLSLWKTAFGEWNGFWELFLETGFSPHRCRCVTDQGQILASLCWFDCTCEGQKIAYIYAVVTHPQARNRGLCRKLVADTHRHLAETGYASALLVPAEEGLRQMYAAMGYRDCTGVSEFSGTAGEVPMSIRVIGPTEYAALRRAFLPERGVVQEGENLAFLSRQAQFFAGNDFLLAAYQEENILHGMELLGDEKAVPGILRALNCAKGAFRCPGQEKPFAMVCPLTEQAVVPKYFGFAFD